MTKSTKKQLQVHEEACGLLEKDTLTYDDKFFVHEHWHEGAENNISALGAFFTPLDLAFDFAIDVHGSRVIDLCAGIGALAFASHHKNCGWGKPPEFTCVEINPRYVEIGKKLLPEATWICADVFDVWNDLGHFDTAIANPPFGQVRNHTKGGSSYTGEEFEYKIIDIASEIADFGTFLVPQMSAPFRYSGARYYERLDGLKFQKFFDQTGIDMEAGFGVDTSYYREDWKSSVPVTEIVTSDFTDCQKFGQLDLFESIVA